MAVKPVPAGYHTATPYLVCKGADQAIEFYKKAFGATELLRMPGPDGKVMHAEIKIGDSPIMLGEEVPEMGFRCPQTLGGFAGGNHALCRGRRRVVRASDRGRRQAAASHRRSILRRPQRHARGPVRPYLDDRDAQGRPLSRTDQRAIRRDDETARPAVAAWVEATWTTER